mgnify:CR=1 FL=1
MVFSEAPIPISDVWGMIYGQLEIRDMVSGDFEMSQIAGHSVCARSEQPLVIGAEGIRELIEARQLNGFNVRHTGNKNSFSVLLNSLIGSDAELYALHFTGDFPQPNDHGWNQLLEGLMVSWRSIGAWQWFNAYQKWQWYTDTKFYTKQYGVLPPNLQTYIQKSDDGIAPDREVIDISLNPGHPKKVANGVYFHPTAEMWLGPHFWQYAKCTKEEAMAADFFLEKRDTPQFLYLKSWPEPFTRPDGEQGRQQQRLWKLFFNEDCEWPPGSGGISDEPMYGPPELMPGKES